MSWPVCGKGSSQKASLWDSHGHQWECSPHGRGKCAPHGRGRCKALRGQGGERWVSIALCFFHSVFLSVSLIAFSLGQEWVKKVKGSVTSRVFLEGFTLGEEAPQGNMRKGKGSPSPHPTPQPPSPCAEWRLRKREQVSMGDAPGRGRVAQQSVCVWGESLVEERTGSSSDGIALLSVEGAWAHCPRPWYLRNIGQKGTGSKWKWKEFEHRRPIALQGEGDSSSRSLSARVTF